MKKILFVFFCLISYAGWSQHTAQLKDGYIITNPDRVLFTIHLDYDLSLQTQQDLTQWSESNQQFFTLSLKGRTVSFDVRKEKFDRNMVEKSMYVMGIDAVRTADGRKISVTEFLKENNL